MSFTENRRNASTMMAAVKMQEKEERYLPRKSKYRRSKSRRSIYSLVLADSLRVGPQCRVTGLVL